MLLISHRQHLSIKRDALSTLPHNGGHLQKRSSLVSSIPQNPNLSSTSEKKVSDGKTYLEIDTTYLDAVKRGDMVTAQRMVDEAANKAMQNSFELVEDSKYDDTHPEIGKNKKSHQNAKHWDYYVKTIVVDGKAYDVMINVRNDVVQSNYSTKEEYVYSIRFRDNKVAATSLVHPATSKATSQFDTTADAIIPQNPNLSSTSEKKVSNKNSQKLFLTTRPKILRS